jgi:hypothetical protein
MSVQSRPGRVKGQLTEYHGDMYYLRSPARYTGTLNHTSVKKR